jgi:hypothetical protein
VSTLPHDQYIAEVVEALVEVGLDLADAWTSDADTRGLHQYLNAVLTLTPGDSGIDADRWREGFLVIWEWHPGVEDGEAPRGPVWLWAKKERDGSNSPPDPLPVDGYANPVQVAAAVAELIDTGRAVKFRPGKWDGAYTLDMSIDAWATIERMKWN